MIPELSNLGLLAVTIGGTNVTGLQLVVLGVVAAVVLFRVLNTDKVKSLFAKKASPTTKTNYDYESLSASMKIVHDHVNKVGNQQEKEALDFLVRLIMKSGSNDETI